jgi:hypothetical protein
VDADNEVSMHTLGASAGRSRRGPVLVGAGLLAVAALVIGLLVVGRDDDGSGDGPPQLALTPGGGFATEMAAADSAMIAQAVRYELVGDLPDLGGEGPVYRVDTPALDEGAVADLAEAFGVEGSPTRDGETWTVGDPEGTGTYLSVYGGEGSGGAGVSFGQAYGTATSAGAAEPAVDEPDKPVTDDAGEEPATDPVAPDVSQPEPPADLPSEAQAEDIARELLERADVLDGEWEVEVADGEAMFAAVGCAVPADGSEVDCPTVDPEPQLFSRSVTFRRLVEGKPVSGLEWYVDVGDGGKVRSAYGVLAELTSLGDYPLRSTTDAFEALQSGEAWQVGVPTLAATSTGFDTPSAAVEVPATDGGSGGGSSGNTGSEPVEGSGSGSSEGNEGGTKEPAPGGIDGAEPGRCEVTPNGDCGSPTTYVPDTVIDPPVGPVEPVGPPVEPVEPPVEPVPDMVETVVEVTGARLGLALQYGTEGSTSVAYVAPAYEFLGSFPGTDTEDVVAAVLALDPSVIATPQVPNTEPPATAGPADPVDEPGATTTSIGDEPVGSIPTTSTVASEPSQPSETTIATRPTVDPEQDPDSAVSSDG